MLNEYRKSIEEIDEQMQKLFKARMQVVLKVKDYKLANNLPILDENREITLLDNLSSKYDDDKTLEYYQRWMKEMFKLSKEYQNE